MSDGIYENHSGHREGQEDPEYWLLRNPFIKELRVERS